jgi:hypothetical protein
LELQKLFLNAAIRPGKAKKRVFTLHKKEKKPEVRGKIYCRMAERSILSR